MARFDRLEVLRSIMEVGLLPMFDTEDPIAAAHIVAACAAGGVRAVEFRNRGAHAYATFAELVRRIEQDEPLVILGIGSIVDAPTAALYLAAGANFVVSPLLNTEVARLCNRRKVPYIPGCATPTEISTAEEFGVEICKVFPGSQLGGPGFVKAITGPCPWFRLMPTGGVDATQESVTAWIKAGAACLGMGSKLITDEAVRSGDYAGLTKTVAQMLDWIKSARGH